MEEDKEQIQEDVEGHKLTQTGPPTHITGRQDEEDVEGHKVTQTGPPSIITGRLDEDEDNKSL